MFRQNNKKYEFKHAIGSHCILTHHELTPEEIVILGAILASFPDTGNAGKWPSLFAKLNLESVPKKLLFLAANAFDCNGNSVLGVVAEHGDVNALQRLIDMGASLNKFDNNKEKKIALYWAVNNKHSWHAKSSESAAAVVKCLLDNGANTEIRCYYNQTTLEYAKSMGYMAAAKLIEEHKKTIRNLQHLCIFKLKNMVDTKVVTEDDLMEKIPNEDLRVRILNHL